MTVRADVAELLHAGYGDRTIARQLSLPLTTVQKSRTTLGLPKARTGNKTAGSVDDLFWRRVKPAGDHLEWIGSVTNKGTPVLQWGGRGGTSYTAYRVAYRIANGHDATGRAHPTCGHPRCVAPEHIADSATQRIRRPNAPGGKPNGSREEVARMLRAGLSNQRIAKLLHTDGKRVARIRADLNLPPAPPRVVTFAEKWAANTEPADGGHVAWTGRRRDGVTPSLVYRGREYSARRAAFEEHYGRAPVGNVFPGCGWEPCVRPDHLEDRTIRQTLTTQFTAIFGSAA